MNRRNLLKAAGATTAIPLFGGVAAAGDDDRAGTDDGDDDGQGRGQGQRECPRSNCIHPTLGYVGLAADEVVPSSLQPDHEVDLLLEFPAEGSDRAFPEFFFEPTGLYVEHGDVVRFTLATPDHTVTAYHPGLGRQRRVPEGIPPFSSPVLAGGAFWLYRFDEPGVYDVLCAPHEIFGMVGRIVVEEPEADWLEPADDDTGDDGAGSTTTETPGTTDGGDDGQPGGEGGEGGPAGRPPELTAALVFADPALNPENIVEEGSVSWDALADESKQILVEVTDQAASAGRPDTDGPGGDG